MKIIHRAHLRNRNVKKAYQTDRKSLSLSYKDDTQVNHHNFNCYDYHIFSVPFSYGYPTAR